jgi:hypothetical protein
LLPELALISKQQLGVITLSNLSAGRVIRLTTTAHCSPEKDPTSLYLSLRDGLEPMKSNSELETSIVPVAFFSLLTKTAPSIDLPTGVGGYDSKAPEISSIS